MEALLFDLDRCEKHSGNPGLRWNTAAPHSVISLPTVIRRHAGSLERLLVNKFFLNVEAS